jgi:ADP-heptose:LPS heptosyltransferase
MNRINYDYLKIFSEIPFLLKLAIIRNKPVKEIKRVLIVNTCLIGDFIVSTPAIREFIKKNKVKADLMVSPPVQKIAERIKGVGKVFAIKSVYNRDLEKSFKEKEENFEEYDLILIMRISEGAYKQIKRIKFKKIKTYSKQYFSFGFHLIKKIFLKAPIKQWREINFEIIGQKDNNLPFKEIFGIKIKDYRLIEKLKLGKEKKIIIHTGSGWKIKFLGNSKWIEVIKRINATGKFKFIFVGATQDEKKDFESISKKLNFEVYSLIGKIDLLTLLLLMKKSDYFIGVDSGPRNMAHIVDLPSICLLGPGPKNFMPLNKRDIVIDKSNCICTNLFCYRRKTCMQQISTEEIIEGFKKLSKKV